jgi:hypothetical protein
VRAALALAGLALGVSLVSAVQVGLGADGPRPVGPDPVVERWPHWPYKTACQDGRAFPPVAAFRRPTGVETGPGEAEAALRRKIAEQPEGDLLRLPTHDWRVLIGGPDFVSFAQGRLPVVRVVTFERSAEGWGEGFSGACRPISVLKGRAAASWTLSSNQPPLRPSTKSLLVQLHGGGCSGGRSQNSRALPPVFEPIGKRRLLMTIRLRPLPSGPHTCEGVVEPPLRVTLPERLGDRGLFDGGSYPPEVASVPDRLGPNAR